MDINELDAKFEALGLSSTKKTSYEFNERSISKKRKNKTNALLIVVITVITSLSLIIATAASGLFPTILGGMGFHIAEENSKIDYPFIKANDKGITIQITSAIAGKNKIIIGMTITGLNNEDVEKYLNNSPFQTLIQPKYFTVTLENGQYYQSLSPQDYSVISNSRNKNEDGSYTELFEINGSIEKTQNVKLNIAEISGITGSWNTEFMLSYKESKIIKIDKDYNINNGKIFVKNIIIDAFCTTVEFNAECENFSHYLVTIQSDKNDKALSNFTGMTSNRLENGILSDGSNGYKYFLLPIPEDSKLTLRIKFLDGYNLEPNVYEINLNEFQS